MVNDKRDDLFLPIVILPCLTRHIHARNSYRVFAYVSLDKTKSLKMPKV